MGRGRIRMVKTTHSAAAAGLYTSQLDLNTVYMVTDKSKFFCTINL
jgi:hypothetical protein